MAKIQYTSRHIPAWGELTPERDYSVPAGATEYTAWGEHVPPDSWMGSEDNNFISRSIVQHYSPYLHSSPEGKMWNEDRVMRGKHPKLFFAQPSMIEGLYSDPSMRHTVPTLLGLMVNDNPGSLTYDDSLSETSAPLAQKGIDLGVVSPNPHNPSARPSNSIRVKTWVDEMSNKDIPISEDRVKAARDTVRSTLRPKKAEPEAPAVPQHLSTQFHPQLPGLEGM